MVPHYYLLAIRWFYMLLSVYFLFYMVTVLLVHYPRNVMLAMPWIIAAAVLTVVCEKVSVRKNMLGLSLLVLGWTIVFVVCYGWDSGVQHLLIPLMVLIMFSVHLSIVQKVSFIGLVLVVRLSLFFYCIKTPPRYPLSGIETCIYQVENTIFFFLIIVVICLIFSTDIQKSEKQLLIYNQELQTQASTDALTGLHNRRYMMDALERQMNLHPDQIFCIAMGDIDLFKKVNDTYGHDCGDEVLRRIASLFLSRTEGKGSVCRWGGEEFFFFLPGMNLDDACVFITDLNIAVSRMPIEYKDITCKVTMTFGLEEYDYASCLKDLIKRADDKLYQGKNNGRNQVIF